MPNSITINGRKLLLPVGLVVGDLKKPRVDDVFQLVDRNLYNDNAGLMLGYLTLDDGELLKICSRKTKKAIFWSVVLRGKDVACGMFRIHPGYYRADCAAAIPSVRGRGLYAKVLRYLRTAYKTPIVSDTRITMATLKSWLKAGAKLNWERSALMINPRNHTFWAFASLETIKEQP